MINKIEGTKNGYLLDESSTGDDWNGILNRYEKSKSFCCLICNSETMKRFRPSLLNFGTNRMTINNKLEYGVFYINGVY